MWLGMLFTCVLIYLRAYSLQSQQNLSSLPQFFKVVKVTLIGREKVDNHIAIVHDYPAVAGKPLLFPLPSMFFADFFHSGIRKGIKHTVTGAGADDKVIGKGNDILQVHQDNVFTLFVFQGVYDFAGKFECIQVSPHDFDNGVENNFA